MKVRKRSARRREGLDAMIYRMNVAGYSSFAMNFPSLVFVTHLKPMRFGKLGTVPGAFKKGEEDEPI